MKIYESMGSLKQGMAVGLPGLESPDCIGFVKHFEEAKAGDRFAIVVAEWWDSRVKMQDWAKPVRKALPEGAQVFEMEESDIEDGPGEVWRLEMSIPLDALEEREADAFSPIGTPV